jgi:hypothetical protein
MIDVHFGCRTSEGRGNFLLQHETREMGPVPTVFKQIQEKSS